MTKVTKNNNYVPSNSKKHKVKVKKTTWIDGLLDTVDEFFDDIEDAIEYADAAIDSTVCKVYNEIGELLHIKHHSVEDHKKDHHGHHHGHGHDDDDDGYHYPHHKHKHKPKK